MLTKFSGQNPSFVTAAASVLLGIVLVLFPEISGAIFCNILGAFLMMFGLYSLWTYIKGKRRGVVSLSSLITAAVSAFFAVICFSSPRTILSFLPFILGVMLTAAGAVKIPFMIDCFKNKVSASPLFTASALVPFALGIILLFNPFGAVKSVIMFFGISLIVNGIMDFSGSVFFRSGR